MGKKMAHKSAKKLAINRQKMAHKSARKYGKENRFLSATKTSFLRPKYGKENTTFFFTRSGRPAKIKIWQRKHFLSATKTVF